METGSSVQSGELGLYGIVQGRFPSQSHWSGELLGDLRSETRRDRT